MRALVDSCILIDHLRGHVAATEFLRAARAPAISQITWIEVMVGASGPSDEDALRALLSAFVVLPVDGQVAEEAVRVRQSHRLKLPDALIFATARVTGRTLVTRNTKDFKAGEAGVLFPYALPVLPS